MIEVTFYVLPVSAATLMERFASFAAEAFPKSAIRAFEANSNLAQFLLANRNQPPVGDALLSHPDYVEKKAILARNPYLELTSATIVCNVPEGEVKLVWHPYEKPPCLKLQMPDNFSVPQKLQLAEFLQKHFSLVRKDEMLTSGAEVEGLPIARFAESVTQRFVAEGARLTQLSADKLQEFTQLLIDKTNALEQAYREKENRLDSLGRERDEAFQIRVRHQEDKERAFDLRENTIVRRAIFDQLLKIIEEQKNVTVSPATQRKRLVIHVVCAVLLALGVTLIAVGAYRFYSAASFDWHLLVPITSGLILTGSTAVFYLRWTDQWARMHSDAEFANRKFKADMSRAAWLVEMFFEWDQKKGTPFPPELISSCTNNLFSESNSAGTRHPFDDIAGLAKQFSKVRVGKAGVEIERGDGKINES
jgi:hypothetical protein